MEGFKASTDLPGDKSHNETAPRKLVAVQNMTDEALDMTDEALEWCFQYPVIK